MTRPRSNIFLAGVLSAAVLLSGCFTGERPSFDDAPPGSIAEGLSTGNQDIDLVLERLESVDAATFSAEFSIETKFGTVQSTGSVVQTNDDRRAVTVDRPEATTRFILDGAEEQTCDLVSGACEDGRQVARISDTQLPYEFYGPAFAKRLRTSADRRINVGDAYTKAFAGQNAQCIDVTVSGGTETFCALDSGVLAEFLGADLTIALTAYSNLPDESQLSPT